MPSGIIAIKVESLDSRATSARSTASVKAIDLEPFAAHELGDAFDHPALMRQANADQAPVLMGRGAPARPALARAPVFGPELPPDRFGRVRLEKPDEAKGDAFIARLYPGAHVARAARRIGGDEFLFPGFGFLLNDRFG